MEKRLILYLLLNNRSRFVIFRLLVFNELVYLGYLFVMSKKGENPEEEEAKNYLLQNIESEVRHESAMKIKEIEAQYKEDADKRDCTILWNE